MGGGIDDRRGDPSDRAESAEVAAGLDAVHRRIWRSRNVQSVPTTVDRGGVSEAESKSNLAAGRGLQCRAKRQGRLTRSVFAELQTVTTGVYAT